jgi:phospholipid-binding lipoprotein MlaA
MMHPLSRLRTAALCGLVALTLVSGGCATTGNPRDPLEPINRGIYHFNDGVDKLVIKPTAIVYHDVLPQFVRTGISNFFSNIGDVIVALNNLLQGKLTQAVSDVGRIAINTTAGVLGVIDVATELGLEKHNEDFGQTLGYWGIGDGPYLVLPFLGPSTLRDTFGLVVDFKTNPITYVDPNRDRNLLYGLWFVNRRAELMDTTKILETAALDPYEFLRDAYLQRRRNLVHDGSPPPEENDIDIKIKPHSKAPDAIPFPRSADGTGAGSLLVSGDAPTPAQLEALEKASREPRSQPVTQPRAEAAPARVVRAWLPATTR